jgi:CYTH domain-containing protein
MQCLRRFLGTLPKSAAPHGEWTRCVAYLNSGEEQISVVAISGNLKGNPDVMTYSLEVKVPNDYEHTIPVSQDTFRHLRDLLPFKPLIVKRRVLKHVTAIKPDSTVDYDWVFESTYLKDGQPFLSVLEVTFPTKKASFAFEVPGWFGREVTEDPAYEPGAVSAKVNSPVPTASA